MNKNTKSNLAIALGILTPILASQATGSASLTYDFRYLPESEFEDRRIKRYKTKFPRYRVITRFAPDYEIYVFYAPNDIILFDGDAGMITLDDLPPDLVTEIKKLSIYDDPKKKVLVIQKQLELATDQITPYMMLHLLGEALYSIEGIDIHVYDAISGQTEELQESFGPNSRRIRKEDLIITRAPINNDWSSKMNLPWSNNIGTTNGVLPFNKVNERRIEKNENMAGCGFADPGFPMFEEARNDIMADCIASLLAKGRIDWITPDNSPAFKRWIENRYDVVQYPKSYQPLIDMWESRARDIIQNDFSNGKIFCA